MTEAWYLLALQSQKLKCAFPNAWLPLHITLSDFYIFIFSRTTKPNWTKHRCDTHWMVLFLNCVQWHCSTSKMAAMNSDWWTILHFWKSSSEPLNGMKPNCISWPGQLSKMTANIILSFWGRIDWYFEIKITGQAWFLFIEL